MTLQIPLLSVSQLNKQIKSYLEHEIGLVHVEGELSNLSKPSSGHLYFTLKDPQAQIRCVYFKNRHVPPLSNKLCDGQQVVASGTLSLYEARGDYQLIIEHLSEAGLGKLYQQFEALKNKLSLEGLFDTERKKPLPYMPQTIGIITSPSGAAIRDMLSTLARRYPLAQIVIYPCDVQGQLAHKQLIHALKTANTDGRCEVIILARGGGSIEDLWAFNNEHLARQIAASTIPVVSGVGHETDFTIADFVADYRAETPTAAAAAVTPNSLELLNLLTRDLARLYQGMGKIINQKQQKLKFLREKLSSPQQTIAVYSQKVDYLEQRLLSSMKHLIYSKRHQFEKYSSQLHVKNPLYLLEQTKTKLIQAQEQLIHTMYLILNAYKQKLSSCFSLLHAVSPLATLDRGYTIASYQGKILRNSKNINVGDMLQLKLAQGTLNCEVVDVD